MSLHPFQLLFYDGIVLTRQVFIEELFERGLRAAFPHVQQFSSVEISFTQNVRVDVAAVAQDLFSGSFLLGGKLLGNIFIHC